MRGDVKHEVYKTLDGYKSPRTIRGGALADHIARRLGRPVYPTVVLKYAKYWAYLSHGAFDCLDYVKSVYRFGPGARKIAGTQFEALPVQSKVKAYKAERGKS